MSGCVYILKSLKNNMYYIGSSDNPERRLAQHNSGNVKATRHKRPYKIVFCQEFPDIEDAREVEFKIKKWKRKDFVEKIIRDSSINMRA